MNFSQLIKPLNKFSTLVKSSSQLDHLNPASGRFLQISNHWVDDGDTCVDELTTILESLPNLNSFQNGNIKRSPAGGSSTKLRYIAHWLLAQSKMRPAKDVIKQLEQFVKTGVVSMNQYVAIWGLHPKQQIRLIRNIYLAPLDNVPPSQIKDLLTGIKDIHYTEGFPYNRPKPEAVLKREFAFSPMANPSQSEQSVENFNEMREILKCLCLIDNSPVYEIAQWYQCDMTTPLIGGVLGWGGWASDPLFGKSTTVSDYNEKAIQRLIKNFLEFPEIVRAKFYIPLKYQNTALHDVLVNEATSCAFELGVAMESFLTPGSEETRYKFRQRGTFLLGGTPTQRSKNFKRLGKIYDLRSNAAHDGFVNTTTTFESSTVKTIYFLRDSTFLFTEMLRKVINSGDLIEDWDGKLLGW